MLLLLVPRMAPSVVCRCGHGRDAHQHYRRGTDCGACGSAACRAFSTRVGLLARLPRQGRRGLRRSVTAP